MNPVDKPGKTGVLMPVEAALQRLLDMAAAAPIREQQVLPLAECDGRVLALDLISSNNGRSLTPYESAVVIKRLLNLGMEPGEIAANPGHGRTFRVEGGGRGVAEHRVEL